MARRQPRRGSPLAPREGIVFFVITKGGDLERGVLNLLHRPPEWNATHAQQPDILRFPIGPEKPRVLVCERGFVEYRGIHPIFEDTPIIEVDRPLDAEGFLEAVHHALAQTAVLPPRNLTLPLPHMNEAPDQPPYPIEMDQLRVLAASDDPKFRTLVRNAFVIDYPSVTILNAANRAEALAIIERERPGLIVAETPLRESLGEIAEGDYRPVVLKFGKSVSYHAIIPLIQQSIRPIRRDV